MLLPVIPGILLVLKCDVTCQNQAFVTEISSRVRILLGKNVTLSFTYYKCFYVLSNQTSSKIRS